jgi:catechol 2,3-dioxygenase-like lactoylglutathione lyase family enzyme
MNKYETEKIIKMKTRLHEIEFGTSDPNKSKEFYESAPGLDVSVNQDELKVFKPGINGLGFNLSTHFPSNVVAASFLTDNLQEIIDRLNLLSIEFDGPKDAHLGMTSLEFKDPDGYIIKVNTSTSASPSWLVV